MWSNDEKEQEGCPIKDNSGCFTGGAAYRISQNNWPLAVFLENSQHPVYIFLYNFSTLSLPLFVLRLIYNPNVDLISSCPIELAIEYMREWQFDFRSFWDFAHKINKKIPHRKR